VVTRHTLSFGNDSDGLALYLPYDDDDARGREMTKVRQLVGRFDRWTLEVFNPGFPLGRR